VPTTGSHEGISTAAAPIAPSGRDGSATGYRSWRTMPLWVETLRQASRRRTQIALGFLVLLPFLLVAAFTLGSDDRRDGAPALVDLATTGAANFTFFTLFASTGFLLVVVIALFAGDTVASEASWASLRYLLASPVPRSQLLRRKLVVALGYSLFALVLLPAVAFLAGGLFFGWQPLHSPLGSTLGTGTSLTRIAIAVGYLAASLLFVAALAFLLGVWTDAPLGAVGGAVLLVIVSNILDAVTALGDLRQYLPTHYSYAWTDVLGATVQWESMARGALWSFGYSLVLLALAWRHFLRKDIVS
jgi:ABC-2 type transport system permease protein